jgi:hypothetical protein
MASTYSPNGLTPARIIGQAPNSNGTTEYRIASGQATNIYTGQPVRVSAGYINPVISAGQVVDGVFQGCRYVQDGEQKFKSYWPGGTSATDAFGQVTDNPNQTYIIAGDGAVSAGVVGRNVPLVSVGAGSTFTGRSGAGADASEDVAGISDLRVIGIVDEPGNTPGDTATKIEVVLNLHTANFRTVNVTAPTTVSLG